MLTLLCVPIMVQDHDTALRDAGEAKQAGADLVEFRVDEFFQGAPGHASEVASVVRLVSDSPLPCIVTCRPPSEGGHYDGPEDARIALFERLGTAGWAGLDDASSATRTPQPTEHPPRYIDIEFSTLSRSANIRQKVLLAVEHPEQSRDLRTSLILSLHDFGGRPPDLTRRVLAMRREPAARVIKIAYHARTLRDNLELFDLLEHRDRPTIALGMGEFGLPSRVLAPKFGGFLTFASLRADAATAPGQPTIRQLLDTCRFRSVGPATRVYGLVGWPVSHSISPAVHNAGFDAAAFDGVYLPLPVPGARTAATEHDAHRDHTPSDLEDSYLALKATLGELIDHPRLSLWGVSVTLPHKENLVRLARERGWAIDPVAERIGAANTLAAERDPAGRLTAARVFNTDVPAIAAALTRALGDPAGKRIAVIGAGGVARAAAYAMASAGAGVTIYNRSRDRADALVDDLSAWAPGRLAAADLDALPGACFDACVNCTPVGMTGGPAEFGSPVPAAALRACPAGSTIVMDTVYRPLLTPLLRHAVECGHGTVAGVDMFVRQAEEQFHVWTGSAPPRGLFDRVARAALAPPA